MKRLIGFACSFSILLLFATTAPATIITFGYTATGNGGTVTGTFGYDTSVPDSQPADPTDADYPGAAFFTGSVVGGPQDGLIFNVPGIEVSVGTSGVLDIRFGSGALNGISLVDTTPPSVFPNDSLPLTLTLSDFSFRNLGLVNGDFGLQPPISQFSYTLQTLTQITTKPIPEPSTMILLGTGLAGIIVRRRKQVA